MKDIKKPKHCMSQADIYYPGKLDIIDDNPARTGGQYGILTNPENTINNEIDHEKAEEIKGILSNF